MAITRMGFGSLTLIGILGFVLLFLIYYFGLRNLKKENRKYWLTGGLVGLVLWVALLVFSIHEYITCESLFCNFAFFIPTFPVVWLFSLIFGIEKNIWFYMIISDILNVLLFFSVGSLIGKIIKKIIGNSPND